MATMPDPLEPRALGPTSLGRRGLLAGALAVGAGAALAACTSNTPPPAAAPAPATGGAAAGGAAAPRSPVTIGFSAPAADHGWIAAIAANAEAQAAKYPDVTFAPVNPTNDITQQIAAVETLINRRVNALVILPNDGSQLTSLGARAMLAGIPVINLDRIFDSPLAYRTWIGGDNYGMGVSAGNYIGLQLRQRNVANPIIGEVAGIDSLPLTQQRSQGFRDALQSYGFSVGPRQAADFTAQGGQRVTANLLQAAPRLDALWNHDDDQGIGVLAAIQQANRSEFFMVGGAGSANAMRAIQADDTVLKATVTYSPTMAGSAVSLARLVAQGRGMSDLVEQEVPASITLASATVTKENVAQYLPLGFES
jgi:ribose transport system substrate-binding protein